MKNKTESIAPLALVPISRAEAGGFVVSLLGGVNQSAPGEPVTPIGLFIAAEAPKSKLLVPNGKGHAPQACEPVGLFAQIGDGRPGTTRWLIPFHSIASAVDAAAREAAGGGLREWEISPASPDDPDPALRVVAATRPEAALAALAAMGFAAPELAEKVGGAE